jgi:hypothetical protein
MCSTTHVWASRRITTKAEDRAYSLMGLFNINMPVLYGGVLEKAFTRLQREIISKTPDRGILTWYCEGATSYRLLADSPDYFRNSGSVMRRAELSPEQGLKLSSSSITNLGLRITMLIILRPPNYIGYRALLCVANDEHGIQRNISLGLIPVRWDLERIPIFICHRPSH